jgi:hypothetical protein
MTMPDERTRSVVRAREFLVDLAAAPIGSDLGPFRRRALTLLRHYPGVSDIHISAAFVPWIWADPAAKFDG